MEIERKWKIEDQLSVPHNHTKEYWIQQMYLIVSPEYEMRMRRSENQLTHECECTLTIKGGSDMVREEYEHVIPESVFLSYFNTGVYPSISKIRRIFGDGLCVDFYLNGFNLIFAEKEFDTVEEANAYALPEWMKNALDVTSEVQYKNRNLAKLLSKQTAL